MQQPLDMAFKVAASEATGMERGGESGTGKGVLARAVHARSPRAHPFVTVHCPSPPAGTARKRTFAARAARSPGPCKTKSAKWAAAQGGTLFLDEIGELLLALQPKLLRLLQEKAASERVGESQTRVCDVRLLAATNRNLNAAVAAGTFREDLLYRLNVIEIEMPPLRDRRADIPVLANHLLRFFSRQSVKPARGFTSEALSAIERYRCPETPSASCAKCHRARCDFGFGGFGRPGRPAGPNRLVAVWRGR